MMRQRFSTVLGCVGSQKKIVSTGGAASAPTESKLGFSTLFGKQANNSNKKQGASSLKLKEGICFSCSSSLKASSQKHSSTRGYAKKESTLLGDYLFRQTTHPLDKIFKPNTVAVIGASEKPGSVGRTLLWNLLATPFGGTIYPVNPKRKNVMGILSYPDIKSIKEPVDLAVICIPAPQVPKAVQDCVDAGVKGAIVISAGFSEAGEQGKQWAQEMVEIARKGGMRIIGPNCLGVMNPQLGLNATFATTIAPPGKVALISQSGALATAILDFAIRENVGFSAFMSIGSMADVNWGDLIEFLGRDPQTEAIILYMESIGDARSFINAARDVALTKPIVVIKVGRTEQGGKAAASHTGTLTGSDNVLDAAFKRCGILRVETIEELFYMAQTLAKQPRPKGNRLSIITNAGGPGALSTDALYSGGGQLSELSEETMEALNKLLPEHWSKGNPIDVLGDAPPERYAKTFEIVAKDNKADGLLVILTPQAMSEPTQTAEVLKQYSASEKKPILASWMGGSVVEAGKRILTNTGIPTFEFPDVAVKVFNYMWQYSKNLETLYEQPDMVGLLVDVSEANREAAKKLIETARKSGRTILTEAESKELMNLYGIPTTTMIIAENEDKAVAAAKQVGFPVVLKIHSETITHKADVGGVKLNLEDEAAVRHAFREIQGATSKSDFLGVSVQKMVKMKDAYEVIFGMNTDQQIGPTILFGTGGTYVEVYKDTVIGLPPLTKTLSKNMIRSTKIYKALSGYRGKPKVDLNLLENLLVRFSQLATDLNTLVQEIDINPLLISATGAIALDARVVVYPPNTDVNAIPKCAIRPYPIQYIHHTTTKDGEKAIIRPVRIEDHYSLLKFFERMTNFMLERGKEHGERYYQAFTKILQQQHMADLDGSKKYLMFKESKKMWDMTVRLCIGDYDSEVVMIIELPDKKEKGTGSHIVGIAMYTRRPYPENSGELSVVIDEEFHRVGLGQKSLEQLISVAKEEGLKELVADINSTNTSMVNLVEKLGFQTKQVAVQYQDGERKEVIATLHL